MIKLLLALLISLAAISPSFGDEIVVIGNLKSKAQNLGLSEIQDIFLGRRRNFDDGATIFPLDLSPLRSEFYIKLTNRSIEQINAYWARIIFSGQGFPPVILSNDKEIIRAVVENTGAVGYISVKSLTDNVKVLFILN